MSVAAAIRIASPDQARVIEHAAAFAKRQGAACFVISVVRQLPYGDVTGEELDVVLRNLKLIAELHASPVMQEGDDVAMTLLAVASGLGIRTLFLQSGTSRRLGRSIAEQLLYLNPPFDVVVVGSE
jgi:Osmosensitive K+ channel histidine kinase